MKDEYDVIIIGGGPSGSTAAIYLGRYARKTLVISKDFGSLGSAGEIENWPGTLSISALELFNNFQNHAKEYGVDFILSEVQDIKKNKNGFLVKVDGKEIISKTLILANGTVHKKLEIPGEEEFLGRGVSYCATCDGMFFKRKKVTIIGGADSAAKSALYLSNICEKVTIIYRKSSLRCENIYMERIKNKKNIEIIYDAVPVEIIGKEKVEKIKIKNNNKEQIIETDGIFIEIGTLPCKKMSDCLNVEVNDNNYIKVDKSMRTNIEGVFAAGDITDGPLKQIITSSSDGAIAAYSAHEYLQKIE